MRDLGSLRIAPALLAVLLAAAGCSSSSSSGPLGPEPGAPSGASAVLSGRVVDQFSGQGVAGAIVRFAGAESVTDASGAFHVTGVSSSGPQPVRILGPTIHDRETWVRPGEVSLAVVPGSFPMAAFDDMAREREERTIRWTGDPAVYVDSRPHGFAGGPALEEWIAEAERLVPEFLAAWSNGEVTAASVTVGDAPPAPGTPGTIVIRFDETPDLYPTDRTAGLARAYWSGDRIIQAAEVWFRFSGLAPMARRAMIGHELGHVLGMSHMDGSESSIMSPVVRTWSLTSFDQRAAAVLYGRTPGNTSIDRDPTVSSRSSVTGSGSIAPVEWGCDVLAGALAGDGDRF